MKKVLLFCCSLVITAVLQARIIHVPADYPTIQLGINAASPGDTVVVSDGVYFGQISFLGKKPLVVASRYIMDGDTNHILNTILDGGKLTNKDNASVVYFVSGEDTTSVLCGVTIRNGKGTVTSSNLIQGGGIWISGSGAIIRNNRITGNKCEDYAPSSYSGCAGAGISIDNILTNNWVVIQDNLITNNMVITNKPDTRCGGGGIKSSSKVRIVNNRITNNLAKRTVDGNYGTAGGGLLFDGDNPLLLEVPAIVTGNTIMGNQVKANTSYGGGVYFTKTLLTFTNNSVLNNEVASITTKTELGAGGMIISDFPTGSTISNNLFRNNSSESWCGAINVSGLMTTNPLITIKNNIFLENHADGWGGALGIVDCRAMLINNVFSHNTAKYGGVGYIDKTVLSPDEHNAWLINNTFSYNNATASSGSFEFNNSNPLILNCIFWKNEAPDIPEIEIANGFAEIDFSDINTRGISGTIYTGPAVISTDPLFKDPVKLIPEYWSPCVNTGTGTYTCMHNNTFFAPINDFAGSFRPRDYKYDMGAYELGHRIHIPADFPKVQQGINAALPGDTVVIAEGTYFEQLNFMGKKPLMVASEFVLDGDTSHISRTIIDGSQATDPNNASVVCFLSGEDTTSVLCGLTITGGRGTYSDLNTFYVGGGVFVFGSSARIRDNIIQNNVLNDSIAPVSWGCRGAGIALAFGYPGWTLIENNKIVNNRAISRFDFIEGGGIYSYLSNMRINNNVIAHNQAKNLGYGYSAGAGLFIWSDYEKAQIIEADVTNNMIKNNEALANSTAFGGGAFAGLANTRFINNIVSENKAVNLPPTNYTYPYWGGGLEFEYMTENSVFSNNVFDNNKCDGLGGAIDIWLPFYTDLPIRNNYFTRNEARSGGAISVSDYACLLNLGNNVFSHNKATSDGGALWLYRGTGSVNEQMARFINNSFYNNNATGYGGAIYSSGDNPLILNSIFWNDTAFNGREIYLRYYTDEVEIANSLINPSDIKGGIIDGGGLIDADPLFTDPVLLTTEPYSPCVDAGVAKYTSSQGVNLFAPVYDIAGVPRPVGSGFDIGAYDLTFSAVGSHKIASGLPFSVWPNPFSSFTTFTYFLPEASQVLLRVYDGFGQLVAEPVNGYQSMGEQKITFNAGNLPGGIYYYRLQSGNRMVSDKMIRIQ